MSSPRPPLVAPRRGRPHALGAGVAALAALIGALASGRTWARMSDWQHRMDGRGMWPGGPTEPTAANPPGTVALLAGLAVALGVAVWWSGRRPRASHGVVLGLTVLYLLAHGPVAAAIVAPAVTMGGLLHRRPPGEWVGWAGLLVPVFWAHAWTEPYLGLDDPSTYLTVLFGVAWVLIPALLLQSAGARRAAADAARAEELHRVAYEERLRVARDIHDVVGHSLSMISLQSGVALHVLDSNPEQARASLLAIRDAAKGSLAELRQTLSVFRRPNDDPLAPTPTLGDLPALVDSVRTGGRIVGLAVPPGLEGRVPSALQTVAYRVVQESLTNVVRHAPRAGVAIALEEADGPALVVRVLDDGPARAVPGEGNGLRGMRERVEAVGGRLSVGVRPGGGLAVEAVLPLPTQEAG
nr:sensor histidine kinase [Propionibacterium sp.]